MAMPPSGGPSNFTVTLDEPVEGALLNSREVIVRGRLTGGAASVDVNGTEVRPSDDGTFKITVELASGLQTITAKAGDATDVVRVTIDPHPPRLVVTHPPRGTYHLEAEVPLRFTATDESALSRVTYLDRDVPPSLGPDFELPIMLVDGLNLMRLSATDVAGNEARESVAVLHGPTREPEAPVDGAFRLRLGPRGLVALGRRAASLLDARDLSLLLPEAPLMFAGIEVTIADVRHARRSSLELTPDGDRLSVTLTLSEVAVDVDLKINGVHHPITAIADTLQVVGFIVPNVVDGRLETSLFDLSVELTNLQVDLVGLPEFGAPGGPESAFEGALESVTQRLAGDLLPSAINEALGGIDTTLPVTLLGVALEIVVKPETIVVSPLGLSLRASGAVRLLNPPVGTASVPGPLGEPSGWDGVPETEDAAIAIDDDFVNLLVYQLYRSGELLPVLDSAFFARNAGAGDLLASLAASITGTAAPDLVAGTPVAMDLSAPLPPVIRVLPALSGAGLSVGLGDVAVHVRTDNAARQTLVDCAVSLLLEGEASVVPAVENVSASHIGVELSRNNVAFDVTTDTLRGEVEAKIEAPIVAVLDSLSSVLPQILAGIPLPAFDALPLSDFSLGVAGPEGDFLRIEGTVVP